MKIQINQSVRHIVRATEDDAEKILQYAYDNYITLSSSIEHMDAKGLINVFPQGSNPNTIEWDVTNVWFTKEEIHNFCRKNNIEDEHGFAASLRVI